MAVRIIDPMEMTPSERYRELADWFGQPHGEALLAREKAWLDAVLPDLFGYYLLEIGGTGRTDLTEASRVLHSFRLAPAESTSGDAACPALYAEAGALPVASRTVDVMLLEHVLEFEAEPHAVLREAERVLMPEGHLVLLAFNSRSPWQLARPGRRGRVPWGGRFYSGRLLRDWLALLGFDLVVQRTLMLRPPVPSRRFQARLAGVERCLEGWALPGGAVHLLVARKRVFSMTPVRPRWRPRRATGAAVPAAGQHYEE
ncbi:MAG: methyltransferase domain-containing protein [Pseudomonadota bacterium]